MFADRGYDFDEFVAARWSVLLHLARLLVGGDRPGAEDLLQESLVKLWFAWSRVGEETLVEDCGEVRQGTCEQIAGQSYLRPSCCLSALGEADHGRQRRVIVAVVEVVRLGVLGEVDADAYDFGGQTLQQLCSRSGVELPGCRVGVAQQCLPDGEDSPARRCRVDLQYSGDRGRQEGEADKGFQR
ncbi:hypothetical protein [Streptomyces sp. PAN_FS17]|uniref:hypothetical protein n=1 Tax=Streptomyces TaxID=1883 RepID=UPI0004C9FF56|nr:hypothetical protein [Streptomyces sp. PAN_FS17]SEE05750.1 hypothetical protein SAMN05216482_8951 [Streptomyces sp. PAN_FS17]